MDNIASSIGELMTGLGTAVVSVAESFVELFYKTGENGGLTFLGIVSLIGLGTSLLTWVFNQVKSLIKKK